MYQKIALAIILAAATCSDAQAHLFGRHHHHSYSVTTYAVPVAYSAPVVYSAVPVLPAPVYVAPAYYPPVPVAAPVAIVQPFYGYVPSVTKVRSRSTLRRSVFRVRGW